MELTGRQATFLVIICSLATKMQRLPCLIASDLGRFGYLYFLFLGLIDLLFIFIALWIGKLAGGRTLYEVLEERVSKTVAKIISFILFVYFFAQIILPYEALHDVFANILFDDLPWTSFSLILVAAVVYLGSRGLKTIGRIGDLYFGVITLSLIGLIAISGGTSALAKILPFAELQANKLFSTAFNYSFWFGDFLIVLMFMGKVKPNDKLGLRLGIFYSITILVQVSAYIVFYGVYQELSVYQSNLITEISEFSLLTLDIGRLDWFLELGVEMSTIIACGLYLYLASYNFSKVFGIKQSYKTTIYLIAGIYIVDIFVLKDLTVGATIVATYTRWLALVVQVALPLFLLVYGLFDQKRLKEKKHV